MSRGIFSHYAEDIIITPHLKVLCHLPHKTILVFSGNRGGKCVTYQTLIETPAGEVPVGELYKKGEPFDVYAWDGEKRVIARASAPFKKTGLHQCYRLELSDGRCVEAADHHRILTSYGWISVEQLHREFCQGHLGTVCVQQNPKTLSLIGVHNKDVHCLMKKHPSCQDGCLMNCCQDDGQFLLDVNVGQAFSPLLGGVPRCSFVLSEKDGLWNKDIYNHSLSLFRPSIGGGVRHFLDLCVEFLGQVFYRLYEQSFRLQLAFQPQYGAETYGSQLDTLDHQDQGGFLQALKTSLVGVNNVDIISSTPIGCQVVFDFEVEKYHNYFAGGLVHHNTLDVAYQYVMRVLGKHPVKEKNLLARKIRCISSTLPESADEDEQDNAQYIELKKLIPHEMIIKDITARSQNLVVQRPLGLNSEKTVFEFRSSKQEMSDLGKIDLSSLWHDEETPKMLRDECKARLMSGDKETRIRGDEYFSLTATNPYTYTYNEVWEKAAYRWRSDTICEKFGLPKEDKPLENKGKSVACIQMATDDNPILSPEAIEEIFEDYDPEEIPLRRYGVCKAITGRVFKTYDPKYCYIDLRKHFPSGLPYEWVHGIGIDYHESRTPWSVGWIAASPEDEWFLWQEFHPAIDGPNAYNTYEIAKAMARKNEGYRYDVTLIDPLAKKRQPNTLFTVVDDLNRHFDQFSKEGLCKPIFWTGWDTKGTKGRDEISMRFKNAVRCGRPFNNEVRRHGKSTRLPTLWIGNTCPKFHKSIMNWSFGEYITASTKAINDPKPKPQSKWSHDNCVLESFAKDHRMLFASHLMGNKPSQVHRKHISVTGR